MCEHDYGDRSKFEQNYKFGYPYFILQNIKTKENKLYK